MPSQFYKFGVVFLQLKPAYKQHSQHTFKPSNYTNLSTKMNVGFEGHL